MSNSDKFEFLDKSLNEVKVDVADIKKLVTELVVQGAVQNQILEGQAEQLKVHIHRTNLLEERVEQTRNELIPVEDHVKFINKLGRVTVGSVKVVGGLIGLIVGLIAIYKFIK